MAKSEQYGPPCMWGGKHGLPLPPAYAITHKKGNREYWTLHGNIAAMKAEDYILYLEPVTLKRYRQ
jgi:hypothetical protein